MASQFDVSSLFRVDNLVAVVTGGGSGLGLIIARALAANGAKAVYIVGRREDKLRAAAAEDHSGAIIPVVGDVSSQESLKAIAKQVQSEQGYLNALIANAGITGHTEHRVQSGAQTKLSVAEYVASYEEAGRADFTGTVNVNTTSVFFTILAFLELLVAGNEQGNVKRASFANCLQTTLLPFKIRVNTLAPGLFVSEMSEPFAKQLMQGEIKDVTEEGALPLEMLPLQRFGKAEELAATALYALSKGGGYTNGMVFLIDGGYLATTPASY